MNMNDLNTLVKTQAILERARISIHNQELHIDSETARARYAALTRILSDYEQEWEALMQQEVRSHPAWPWLQTVKGIGQQTAALILSYLLPPLEDKGPSTWFKAAGLYPVAVGEEMRLPRYDHLNGQRATWHPRLRRNLHIVGTSLMRATDFYYQHYLECRAALALKHPDWKGRVHSVAFWKMVKLFLAHLYEVWALEIGVQPPEPYPIALLGHKKIRVPHPVGAGIQ